MRFDLLKEFKVSWIIAKVTTRNQQASSIWSGFYLHLSFSISLLRGSLVYGAITSNANDIKAAMTHVHWFHCLLLIIYHHEAPESSAIFCIRVTVLHSILPFICMYYVYEADRAQFSPFNWYNNDYEVYSSICLRRFFLSFDMIMWYAAHEWRKTFVESSTCINYWIATNQPHSGFELANRRP